MDGEPYGYGAYWCATHNDLRIMLAVPTQLQRREPDPGRYVFRTPASANPAPSQSQQAIRPGIGEAGLKPALGHNKCWIEEERVLSVSHRCAGKHRRRTAGKTGKLDGGKQ